MKELISNVKVYGLDESIKAAKYPMSVDVDSLNSDLTNGIRSLAQSPIGHAHDNWLNGITVQFDLTCTNKMWVEAERYRFLYIVSSESTMHRITKFNIEEQCNEYVEGSIISMVNRLVEKYNAEPTPENYLRVLYNIPSGFRLTARMTTNYRQLKTIYEQRRNHRLPEWREFCKWIETLPQAELITGATIQADKQAKIFQDCLNEICLKCGDYKNAHEGACKGCKFSH